MAIWIPMLTGRRGPKYLQIVDAMADDIASGVLAPGTRLPPQRELAYALNISPNTTSRAYAEAVARALVQGEVGRGTFVRAPGSAKPSGDPADLRRPQAGPIDLSRNLPCPGLAATDLAETLTRLGHGKLLNRLTDYQTEGDLADHKEAGLAWLDRCRVKTSGDEIIITAGAQHGILCALMAATRPGDLLLTEALTYAPVKAMADRLGLKLKPVPIDDNGLCPDALEDICRSHAATALYLCPTLQTPTTATMSPDRRSRIAESVRRHRLTLIEDDVFGLLKMDHPVPIAAQAPERTVYITSTSKCLAPGLRVGFVRAPAALAKPIHSAVNLTCWMTPPLMVEIAARWILDGTADRLTALQRTHAAKRQAIAAEVLAGHKVHADPYGLHLWLMLPGNWSADRFRSDAAARDVQIVEGAAFAVDPGLRPNAVRLCLSHEADEARLRRGLERLAKILGQQPAEPSLVL